MDLLEGKVEGEVYFRVKEETVRIGELSRRSGVPVHTLRYYDRIGLLPAAERAGNNYREYGERSPALVEFIHRCKALGFTLEEIKSRLDEVFGGNASFGDIEEAVLGKVAEVEAGIVRLKAALDGLKGILERCDKGRTVGDCFK
jgi:MerR family mercuric resistance operon transcriptional regulator